MSKFLPTWVITAAALGTVQPGASDGPGPVRRDQRVTGRLPTKRSRQKDWKVIKQKKRETARASRRKNR